MAELSKYQQTAERILELEPFKIEMMCFTDLPMRAGLCELRERAHECGTAFCIAGRLAALDDFPDEYWKDDHFDFRGYSTDLCGFNLMSDEWRFLFEAFWPDSLDAAKERAAYVLEHNDCPSYANWRSEWGFER